MRIIGLALALLVSSSIAGAQQIISSTDTELSLELLRQRGGAIFSTKHAALWPEGSMSISGMAKVAGDEAADAIAIDCPSLIKSTPKDGSTYTVFLSGNLTNLNIQWTVAFKPDGEVVYENIKPTPEMAEYFTEFAKRLACAEK